MVTVNGFKAAYAIKDGAEGPRGWVVFPISFHYYFYFILLMQVYQLIILVYLTWIIVLQSSGLPWIPPPKALSLDFGNLADAFSGAVGVILLTLFHGLIIIYADKMHN